MNCPFCGKEMLEGSIPVSRSNNVAWWGKDPDTRTLDEVKLSKWMQDAEAFYCPDCRQVIVPVPEIEDFFDKLDRKVDEIKEKLVAAKDGFLEHREEKQNQKEKQKREGKDPWEL